MLKTIKVIDDCSMIYFIQDSSSPRFPRQRCSMDEASDQLRQTETDKPPTRRQRTRESQTKLMLIR